MPIFSALIAPITSIIDKVIPDPKERDAAKLQLLQMQGTQELAAIQTQMSAILAEAQSADPWTSRARPGFLYVMYAMILWSLPMGLIAAIRPAAAHDIANGITGYLNALPEALYGLFGTGYLGYTAARQFGKTRGTDK
jgi:glycerol dehydrogenase-like iron-containing ADH family enzyme